MPKGLHISKGWIKPDKPQPSDFKGEVRAHLDALRKWQESLRIKIADAYISKFPLNAHLSYSINEEGEAVEIKVIE